MMKIISHTTDGTVRLIVGNPIKSKIYTYFIDPLYLEEILKMAKHKPWAALNELKKRNRESISIRRNRNEINR